MYYVSTEKHELVNINELSNDITNLVKSNILNSCYPIGSIYMSMNSTSPSTLFGGNWTEIGQGRVLVGVGTGTDDNGEERSFTVKEAKGEYNHTLTVDEMPSHKHDFEAHLSNIKDVCDNLHVYASNRIAVLNYTSNMSWRKNPDYIWKIDENGGSGPHNNMQPYLAVYMWERIS